MSIKRYNSNYSLQEIEHFVRAPTSQRYVRFYLLHDDETIKQEITDWVLPSGSLEKKNESGQSRSTSITLKNEKVLTTTGYKNGIPIKQTSYLWTPTPNKGNLWTYNKIKVVSGLVLKDKVYEVEEGVFVLHDPSMQVNNAEHTISMQCYDKFALLDGTIDGKGDMDYEIPLNTDLFQALESMLRLERRPGVPFDLKPLIFPIKYKNEKTPYTIKKTSESSIGEIIKDLVLMISCDVRYDDSGNMVITDSLADLDYHNRKISWNYSPNEFKNPSITLKRSQIKNKVTVVGSNINGIMCKGEAVNDNPASNYNINSSFGIKSIKITDDLIYTPMLCKERARYELKKYAQNYATINFTSNYIPHLEPGDIVRWTYDPWGIEQEELLVNTISLPYDGKSLMSLSCTNLKELPL